MTVTVRTGRGGVCARGRAAASRPPVTRNWNQHLPGSLSPSLGPLHTPAPLPLPAAHWHRRLAAAAGPSQPAGDLRRPARLPGGLARAGKGGQLPQLRCSARGRRLDSPAAGALRRPGPRQDAAAPEAVAQRLLLPLLCIGGGAKTGKPGLTLTGMLRTCATAHLAAPARKPASLSGGRLNSDALMYADRKASGA